MSGLFATERVAVRPEFEAWRTEARRLLAAGTPPESVDLVAEENAASLNLPFALAAPEAAPTTAQQPRVPKSFVEQAEVVACHSAPERWNLLYRTLWRLQTQRDLLKNELDDDVATMHRMASQVRRDVHKMHAFVRFTRVEDEGGEHYIAWYRPDHRILPLAILFFRERFAVMRWTILTDNASVSWDPSTQELAWGEGVPRKEAPGEDELASLWRGYYGAIFNPARLNTRAMRSEMPVRYWANMPELNVLPHLIQGASTRVETMMATQETGTAAEWVPREHTLPVLTQAVHQCHGCDLYKFATQAVFGAGCHPLGPTSHARLMLVGEQPGDEEDRRGEPFVGPAGRVLNQALEELGLPREEMYVTNAVKHFKFVERGKRRIHESPKLREIAACRPWLLAELDAVQPRVVVCLGASASKSLLGAKFALMKERGKVVNSPYAERVIATLHPSAVLRAQDDATRHILYEFMKNDIALANELAQTT